MEEEKKVVEEGAVVINEKDIISPEEVKPEETIEVETPEVIIEKDKEEVTSTGETQEELKGESTEAPEEKEEEVLVAKLSVYYDKKIKTDIVKGKAIKDVYEAKGVKLTEARKKELIKAGVAEYSK